MIPFLPLMEQMTSEENRRKDEKRGVGVGVEKDRGRDFLSSTPEGSAGRNKGVGKCCAATSGPNCIFFSSNGCYLKSFGGPEFQDERQIGGPT